MVHLADFQRLVSEDHVWISVVNWIAVVESVQHNILLELGAAVVIHVFKADRYCVLSFMTMAVQFL